MGTLYFKGNFSSAAVVESLGTRFLGSELSLKAYPSCRATHAAVDATLALAEGESIHPADVERVVVHGTHVMMRSCGAPFDPNRMSQVAAQFSIPYTVALALVNRGIFLDDFVEKNILSDKQVVSVAQRVHVVEDQEPRGPGITPAIVEITMRCGKTYTKRTDVLRGHPANPLGFDWTEAKFRKCAAVSARPLSRQKIETAIYLVRELENLDDVRSVVQQLA